ncbi:non-ribosomal peptide synthetase [Kitasatospora atroaurantiaca]|uniref:Nonribosomal peptide synthetase MxcG n=1 Tax=Kitasatospora atroaurantiaca TaxID=285545 RepID=A0A561EK02_9ACTN|nr:non-ribosomal peptide synthetase [Kitasatospora atroaurantiaca]TWE15931.1 nonribosomal peptide synthetase MxcG [Kitasatospora atroaurantiaca]
MTVSPGRARQPSAAQYGVWSGQQLVPQDPLYNLGQCVEIAGPLDVVIFERALRTAVTEAESLHCRYTADQDGTGARSTVEVSQDWALQVVDVSAEADPWAAAERWMRADLAVPADLTGGRLFAQALFHAGGDRHFWYQRVHHIALDGFGLVMLIRRVAALYTALVDGAGWAGRAFGPLQAVLDEDAAYRTSQDFERDRAFWTARFRDRPVPVSIAGRAARASGTPVRESVQLPLRVGEALAAAARATGTTRPALLLAATAAYLHRHTGAPEIVLGLPIAGRLGSVSRHTPCMQMNILPLRIPVGPASTLRELATHTAHQLRQAGPHQRYRHEQLRRDLQLLGGERRLLGPVVNLMPFENRLTFAGRPAVGHTISPGPVEDLSVGVHSGTRGGGIRLEFSANPQLYGAEELSTRLAEFSDLLARAVSTPGEAIHRNRREPARTPVLDGGPLPVEARPVSELILDQASTRPDAVAVEYRDQRITYRQLAEDARQLADRLIVHGAGPGRLVAVLLPRGAEAAAVLLGVLLAGAGYLPLDPDGPPARNDTVLTRARPSLLVTTAEYRNRVPATSPATVLLLDRAELTSHHPGAAAPPRDEDPAYVQYTSGSTGRPNGVVVGHGALAHFAASASQVYRIGPRDRVLQFAPLHFDTSVEEIFLTLSAGATLVVRTEEMLRSVPGFLTACDDLRITVLDLPTALWHEVALSLHTGAAALPASVHTVIIGGEAAAPERVRQWRRQVGPQVRLLNTYGPTEATVVATCAVLHGDGSVAPSRTDAPRTPIGRPLPGVRAAVLDGAGRPVRAGAAGELHLMGGGLATGYLGDTELTARRFVLLDHLPGRPRAYRTGDLVRRRDDGRLVFLGRVDEELKTSGHRVHPADVENALLGHPRVREAAVVGQELADGTKRLTAYVVGEPPGEPTAGELRHHLSGILPAAAVPAVVVLTSPLPRTGTGKLDRRALPARAAPSSVAAGELERLVLAVWEEVLGVPGLSVHDDFFDLGGHSLQTLQAAHRLGIRLGRDIPAHTVFRHPTAAALAEVLRDGEQPFASVPAASVPAELRADAVLHPDVAPATSAARRQGPARCVLLTGATGYVGAHLLHELLARTDARIVCAVRSATPEHGLRRIRQALTDHRLGLGQWHDRVQALPSDLTRPGLGLDPVSWDELAEECDAIYHSAAAVSMARSYRSMRAANVSGTEELLRLAATGRPSSFHHLSTLALSAQDTGLPSGYLQSKWAAERLVEQAATRGLPVTVYRLGRVTGPPATASVNESDVFWRLLRAAIRTGALPAPDALDVAEVWTPADYVARAVVHLSSAGTDGVFDLAPHAATRLSDVVRWVTDYGFSFERRAPEGTAADEADEADQVALSLLDLGPLHGLHTGSGRIPTGEPARALADSGIHCPPVDRRLIHRYLDHCVATGFLPPPNRERRTFPHPGGDSG